MKNLDKQTASSICKYLLRREACLDRAAKLKLLSVALERATTVQDYIETACGLASPNCGDDKTRAREAFSTAVDLAVIEGATTVLISIARNVIAPDLLDDKVWGRQLLERGVENATEFNDLVEAALEASDPEGLADRPWAKTLLKQAITDEIDFDSILEAAAVAGRSDAINDKRWSRKIFLQALAMDEVMSHELIQAALLIADDDVLGDKDWGRDLIEKACEDLQYGDDYVKVALCYAHTQKLNDKAEGWEWFKRAVDELSIWTPTDFFEIAMMVGNKDVLSNDIWATALCEITANNSRDASKLVDIACFVSTIEARGLRENFAEEIFKRAHECAETPNELAMVAINVAIRLPAPKREWARMIFDQALQNADEDEKEMIEESMEEYLIVNVS